MRQKQLIVLGVLVAVLLGGADYLVNVRPTAPVLQSQVLTPPSSKSFTLQALEASGTGYVSLERARVTQFFEKTDVSDLPSVAIFRSVAAKEGADPLIVYEAEGPAKQGPLTYLNIKLKILQALTEGETINENNQFGQNSFYLNDLSSPDTAFLTVQLGDVIMGFQYSKANPDNFLSVKSVIASLEALVLPNS